MAHTRRNRKNGTQKKTYPIEMAEYILKYMRVRLGLGKIEGDAVTRGLVAKKPRNVPEPETPSRSRSAL